MVKRSRIVAFFIILIAIFATIGTTSKGILGNIKLGLDLQGGFEVLYEVKPEDGGKVTQKMLNSTAQALTKRIDVLGVSEPNIQIEGNDRIRVQLAGVTDQNEARKILSTQAKLSFRDHNDKEMMTGADLKEGGAQQTFDENNSPVVQVTLKDPQKFKKISEQISAMPQPTNVLAIWLDFEEGKDSIKKPETQDNMISNPSVREVFDTETVMITGQFTIEEAKELANLLNAGALPVELDEIYSTSVGAKFGEQALNETIFAGIIGISLVFAFMIFYYRFPGFIAVITLAIYLFLTLLVFDWMNAVLTLPGVAALILGVGMAVDANIITYERIKDELKLGRSVPSAYAAGNKNSLATITDANLTTLLAAAVLFFYGTSSVKGFATTLIISILMSFITAVYGTRLFMGLWINSRFFNKRPSWLGVNKKDIHELSETRDVTELPTPFDKWDFVKRRKVFYGISTAFIIIGIIVLSVFKMNLGIDFTSGTRIEFTSNESLTQEKVKDHLAKLNLESEDIVISGDNNETGVVRFKGVLNKDEIAEVKDYFNTKVGDGTNISTVSPTIGKELAKNALIAVFISSLGIILYATIRFEWRMALPAVISLFHDAFFIITLFSVLRLEVDLTFIAAILTIIGYSINDSIVTFDRIRENMRKKRKIKKLEELEEIVNMSIRQTLTRSFNTVFMIIITVAALMIFGSPSIANFSIALLIGMIVGVYSSLYIASQLWLDLKGKELKKKGVLITYKEKKPSQEAQV